jgi:uncharacterized protein (DUF2141 family)
MKSFFVLFAIWTSCFSFTLQAETPHFAVSGTITVHREGVIILRLLNEDNYAENKGQFTPYELTIPVGREELEQKKLSFTIKDVVADRYCIICFLDTNGNGKLDKGLFGPMEPWSIFKKPPVILGRPQFKDVAFNVEMDSTEIEIELK